MAEKRAVDAVKTAQLCELIAAAIRRDIDMMARCGKIGKAVGDGDKFVSVTRTKEKIVDLRYELLKLRDLL